MIATLPNSPRLLRRPTGGFVVVLVLITVLIASFMLTKFVERAGTELLTDARAGDRLRLRREAYSALEVTLAVLADFRARDHGLFSPAQGWERPLELAGYTPENGVTIEVAITDESGRVSLPQADAPILEALLEWSGVERARAEQAGAALLGWMQADQAQSSGTGRDDYDNSPIPYHAAGRPPRSLDELAAVTGVRDLFFADGGQPTAVLNEFAENISLQSFPRTNLNAAPPAVLAAGGFDDREIETLGQHLRPPRRPAAYFRNMAEAGPLLGRAVNPENWSTEAQVLRVTLTVRDGAASYRLSATVAPPRDAAAVPPAPTAGAPPGAAATPPAGRGLEYPFQVLEVREDLASPEGVVAHE